MKFAHLLTMFAAALSFCGCSTVIPPTSPPNPVPVYLTNYGKHSSVLLTDPRGHFNEYAYGDFQWFAQNHTGIYDAVRSLFFSTQPTIGRRQLAAADDIESVKQATKANSVVRFVASKEKVDRLIEELDREYNDHLDTITYNVFTDLWYVKAGKHYSAFHNCNHATAYWLKQLGCQIKGVTLFSYFKFEPQPSTSATMK